VIWDKDRKAHYQIFISNQKSHKYFDDFSPGEELVRMWRLAQPDGKVF
jgi:hypothetical protein